MTPMFQSLERFPSCRWVLLSCHFAPVCEQRSARIVFLLLKSILSIQCNSIRVRMETITSSHLRLSSSSLVLISKENRLWLFLNELNLMYIYKHLFWHKQLISRMYWSFSLISRSHQTQIHWSYVDRWIPLQDISFCQTINALWTGDQRFFIWNEI
jgi:hypothetical protein